MQWVNVVPVVAYAGFALLAFGFGLAVGSFLNVLIARLPFEKSVVWPGSRCGACFRPLRSSDNLPIVGYLRLRGRCRFCGTHFSARYLWVELGTGLAFLGVFLLHTAVNWFRLPGLVGYGGVPTLDGWLVIAAHCALLSLLIAAAVIDLQYRVIPGHITIAGTLLGLAVSAALPWPWPHPPAAAPAIPTAPGWNFPQYQDRIPYGVAPWPAVGPPPAWAPAGSWQLGLLTGLVGAAAGQFVGRAIKFLFEIGFGRDALGVGDADLLMMIGAFLGWQVAVLALPAGAFVLLPIILPLRLWMWATGRAKKAAATGDPADDPSALPFGPGIAAGAVACWLGWPWLGELVRAVFFDYWLFGIMGGIMAGLLMVAGVILRRPADPAAEG